MIIQNRVEEAEMPPADSEAMHPDLAAFCAAGDFSAKATDHLLAGCDLPLVEPGELTFLWRGVADRVELLRWIHAGVDRQPLARLPFGDVWHLRLPVTDGGRFEYKLSVHRDGGEDWILDPLNPNQAGDPFGQNSVAMTHGYAPPEWSLERGAPQGRLEALEIDSAVFGLTRTEQVYLPHGYDPSGAYPLVVVHDGGDYDTYAGLTVALDNLIDDGAVPPLVAVLIQAGDRMDEYPKGRRHARYVVNELLPAVTARYAISNDSGQRILLGASLGAVASLSTAFRYPGAFGGLILKSGSFILDSGKLAARPHQVFHRIARLVEVMRRATGPAPARAFVSTGELEGLAAENEALAEFLRERGVLVLFQSTWDGHHWHNWRDQLHDALVWVLDTGPDC